VVHVLDASRSVPVTTSLLSKDGRDEFVRELREKQQKARENFLGGPKKETISLAEARAAAPKYDWDSYAPPVPSFTGTRTIEAKKLYAEAREYLEKLVKENRLQARGIYGFFPANSVGDDIAVFNEDGSERVRFHTLRQQLKKTSGKPNVALSDWVSGEKKDFIGGFVVGIHGADEYAKELDAAHDPYGSIMVKAIADRLAEAFAEKLHHAARIEWGYEKEGELTKDALIHENYQGIRPAPGYPAQPDHTEKPILFELLGATDATGVFLTESCAMHPGAAVCGLYFSHPESHYFALSELQKDQIEDYAKRKGMTLEEAEKWLGPWLGYV
jgi:5-methyltetrahydrofolate--homocysteine methyltransferase